MTRLDASSGEPSMEEILASIRRIIAEDPPGSRPAPQLSQAATSTPEPYLRATPAKPDPASFAPSPFLPMTSEPVAPSGRIEPSFAKMRDTFMPIVKPAATSNAVQSVDAQLSELLGDIAPKPKDVAAESFGMAPLASSAAKPVTDFDVDFLGLPREQPAGVAEKSVATNSDAKPGFTFSRDGFLPPKADSAVERDPFDFDLGPSPFASKVAEPAAAPAPSADLGGFVPTRPADIAAVPTPTPASEFASAAVEEPVAEAPVEETREVHVASPSVTATLSPVKFEYAEPAALVFPEPSESVISHKPVERDVIEVFAAEEAVVDASGSYYESHAVAVSEASGHGSEVSNRSMEDTVAELLRPMLKSWLAENMPIIVERALRRELSEQLLSEHKTAAE